jgi:hypothetical protein
MRQRLVFASFSSVIGSLVAVLMFGVLGACGGSSSETPPPLQPDPKGFRYASVPVSASVEGSDAGALSGPNELDPEEKPRAPAGSTWGATKPAH